MSYEPIAIVPIIIGIVEMFKRLGIPAKWSPVVAVILGVISSFAFSSTGNVPATVIQGMIYGLSASGLYSASKNTVMKKALDKPSE